MKKIKYTVINFNDIKNLSKEEMDLFLEFESISSKGYFYSTSFTPYTSKDKVKLMKIIKETKYKGDD